MEIKYLLFVSGLKKFAFIAGFETPSELMKYMISVINKFSPGSKEAKPLEPMLKGQYPVDFREFAPHYQAFFRYMLKRLKGFGSPDQFFQIAVPNKGVKMENSNL